MRILHLIDPASPGGGPGTLRLAAEALARTVGASHDVLIVGNSRHREQARRCGLRTRGRLGAPLNRPRLARSGLRSYLAATEPVCGGYDLLHAWTLNAAGLCVQEAGRRPVLATAVAGLRAAASWTVRRRLRSVPVLAATAAVRELETAGWASGRLFLVPPGVDRDAVGTQPRALIRERWSADETTFVAGLLGEPPAWADGRLAINALGRVALSGRAVRLILHHDAAAPGGLRRWLGRLGLGDFVVIDDAAVEPWRIVAGLDAAVIASSARAAAPSVTPALWAMAAGVPVVAEASASLRALIEDGASGLLFAPGDVHGAPAGLLRVYGDRREPTRMADAAREIVEQRFDIAGFAARLEAVYEQCARGEPIRVPEAGAGADRTHDFAVRSTRAGGTDSESAVGG